MLACVDEQEFGALSNQENIYFIPVSNDSAKSCVELEKGGTDPFGAWKEAYVAVHYDADKFSYDYYFTFYDDAGYGMQLTKSDDIATSGSDIKNPSPVKNADIIKNTVGAKKSSVASAADANPLVLSTTDCKASTAKAGPVTVS